MGAAEGSGERGPPLNAWGLRGSPARRRRQAPPARQHGGRSGAAPALGEARGFLLEPLVSRRWRHVVHASYVFFGIFK